MGRESRPGRVTVGLGPTGRGWGWKRSRPGEIPERDRDLNRAGTGAKRPVTSRALNRAGPGTARTRTHHAQP